MPAWCQQQTVMHGTRAFTRRGSSLFGYALYSAEIGSVIVGSATSPAASSGAEVDANSSSIAELPLLQQR